MPTARIAGGRFAWFDDTIVDPDTGAPIVVVNHGATRPLGFVHREMQGLITEGRDAASMLIPAGQGVSLCSAADVWVENAGAQDAGLGGSVYVDSRDGSVHFGQPQDTLFTGGSPRPRPTPPAASPAPSWRSPRSRPAN